MRAAQKVVGSVSKNHDDEGKKTIKWEQKDSTGTSIGVEITLGFKIGVRSSKRR